MSTSDGLENQAQPPASSPPPVVTEHDGNRLPPDIDWFAPPPAEIGELRSAHTTLKQNQQPWSTLSRVLLAGGIGLGITLVADLTVKYFQNPGGAETVRIIGAIVGICGALIAWFATRFKHHVSYVGKSGLARSTIVGRRENPPKDELFQFASAAELRTGETRHYHNGVYTGTHYHFQWTDAQGKLQFKLAGQYSSAKSTPKTKHP